ncbi:TPA: nucleotidyl transferase AbiEii/AbiGii toxin family protein [Candidatus Micrarchaeota archaeon]|nr:nucleotidyl transferase AbiEii/AbiGii toxin family protein [Candidatus Micrarchaeota archaeon]
MGVNIDELKKYAELRSLNIGQTEKDYYQSIVLFSLYNKISGELVFKGGTALSKCYGLNRFSEDLDFSVVKEIDFAKLVKGGLEGFGIEHTMKETGRSASSKKYKIKIKGPLYKGLEKTLCSVTLDFSMRESVVMKPELATIGFHMDVIPAFEVYAMAQKEIFAEKVRAIMSRESARDLYDIVFLLRKGIGADSGIINKKLEFVGQEFSPGKFAARCKALGGIWQTELKSLVKHVPAFDEYIREIKKWAGSQ